PVVVQHLHVAGIADHEAEWPAALHHTLAPWRVEGRDQLLSVRVLHLQPGFAFAAQDDAMHSGGEWSQAGDLFLLFLLLFFLLYRRRDDRFLGRGGFDGFRNHRLHHHRHHWRLGARGRGDRHVLHIVLAVPLVAERANGDQHAERDAEVDEG